MSPMSFQRCPSTSSVCAHMACAPSTMSCWDAVPASLAEVVSRSKAPIRARMTPPASPAPAAPPPMAPIAAGAFWAA